MTTRKTKWKQKKKKKVEFNDHIRQFLHHLHTIHHQPPTGTLHRYINNTFVCPTTQSDRLDRGELYNSRAIYVDLIEARHYIFHPSCVCVCHWHRTPKRTGSIGVANSFNPPTGFKRRDTDGVRRVFRRVPDASQTFRRFGVASGGTKWCFQD